MFCHNCGDLQELQVCASCSPIAESARRQVRVTIAHERRNLVHGTRRHTRRLLRSIARLQDAA